MHFNFVKISFCLLACACIYMGALNAQKKVFEKDFLPIYYGVAEANGLTVFR